MTHEIGDASGKIWQFLEKNPKSALQQIHTHLKLERNLFFMAVGWLAREHKLAFEGEGKDLKVSLR